MTAKRQILLIITGGIAAYKSLHLIRLLREKGYGVRPVMTAAATQFVTPLSVAALCENKVYQEMFSLTDETEMGHIQLSRSADLVLVAPASADMLSKMANGICNDLASTLLLATNKPVMVAPAMNVKMWENPATCRNIATLKEDGVTFVGPVEGGMACGEYGMGRFAEPEDILNAVNVHFNNIPDMKQPLLIGKKIFVTSGPTHEPIDPVRYIANRSSGRQGHAIAEAFAEAGADVTLISGPTQLSDPKNVHVLHIESAREMLEACLSLQSMDVGIFAAAVADWHVKNASNQKTKKENGGLPVFELAENPDILKTISNRLNDRPNLVIGFAAETENVVEYAQAKRKRKGCDWILANDVSPTTNTFGGAHNEVHFITETETQAWPKMTKEDVANRLVQQVGHWFAEAGEEDEKGRGL